MEDYAREIGYGEFDAERFLAYYDSNGWRVGKNPMQDWRAAVRSWHARDKPAPYKDPYEGKYTEFDPWRDW